MRHDAPAIPRLGIPAYNWWNEALHGVARAGAATVFPQAIGLGATFDEASCGVPVRRDLRRGARQAPRAVAPRRPRLYKGLTFWSPNINIFRDPRWGRGHETYGEDPYLTARLGVAFCAGCRVTIPATSRLVATPKHFAVHSGPEALRHASTRVVARKDLRRDLPARVPRLRRRGDGGERHGRLQPHERRALLREPDAAWRDPARRVGLRRLRRQRLLAHPDFHEGHKVTKTWEESAALA